MSPGRARLRVAAVLVVAIIVQTTFASDLRVDHVAPDFMLLVTVCAALEGGGVAGAVVGFFAGLLADLTLTATPVGLSALAWCLTGWGVGQVRGALLPEGRLLQPVFGFLATAGGVIVFVLVAGLSGQSVVTSLGQRWLARVLLIEAIWAAVLVIPVAAVMRWALRGLTGAERMGRSDALVGR